MTIPAEIDTTLTYDGVTYTATIVTIERTTLGRDDHGLFSAGLQMIWSGSVTTVGTHILDGKPVESGLRRPATAYGMQYIMEIIETVLDEYGRWEDLTNKRVFMLHTPGDSKDGFKCQGIASLDGKRVMIFDQVKEHVGEGVSA